MDKLKKLMSMCKCGVFVTVNEHRDYYLPVEEAVQEIQDREESQHTPEDGKLAADIIDRMIKTDTIINVQFYPEAPIGSFDIYDYDLDRALERALECF